MPGGDPYKYKNDKDLLADFSKQLKAHFQPFFISYNTDRKVFVIQCLNLVLLIIAVNFFLSWTNGLTDSFLDSAKGSARATLRIVLVVFLVILVSALASLTSSKAWQWQTLFKMNFEYALKWLKRFIAFNIVCYIVQREWADIKSFLKYGPTAEYTTTTKK